MLVYLCDYNDRHDYFMSLLPYGLVSLASYLKQKGCEVVLANLSGYGYKRGADFILKENPGLLGVSIFTFNRRESFKLTGEVRKRNPKIGIVAGGPHATALAGIISEREKSIDWIIRGEGETALRDLAGRLGKGDKPEKIIEGRRNHNLDKLPFTSGYSGRSVGVDNQEQYKYIITSRGCPHRCSYCSSPSFWGREVRFRSAENIVREIESLYREKGIIYFSIRDDNFTLKRERVIEFCRLLRKKDISIMWNCQSRVDTVDREMLREMKLAGLEHIQYGVESGSERILKQYDKSIDRKAIEKAAEMTRETGIYLSVYLMCGMEGEKQSDAEKTVDLVRKIKPSDAIVSPVAYYPGTSLYEEGKEKGFISDTIWFTSSEPGIYLRNDAFVPRSMERILGAIEEGRERWIYGPAEFRNHRESEKGRCWVTSILEGDYYAGIKDLRNAKKSYGRVIEMFPENIWGHYKMGGIMMLSGEPEKAIPFFTAASERVPRFYGSWMKLAEANLAAGRKEKASLFAGKAASLHSRSHEIKRLLGKIKNR